MTNSLNDPGTSAIRTGLCDDLGNRHPIFGFSHSVETVIAVCAAGGVGIYGGTRRTPEELEAAITQIRSAVGDAPFGVDLVIPRGMPDADDRKAIEDHIPSAHRAFVEGLRQKYAVPDDGRPGSRSRFVRSSEVAQRQVEVVIDSRVRLLALGIGSPGWAIKDAKRRGIKIVSLVGHPKHARAALSAGADVLVAQGYDAGGHTGPIGTFSLIPQVVDVAGGVPVVAAGGVATGRQFAAALALGAVGVWLGTAWLFCKEERTNPVVLDKLVRAGSADAVISRADSGKSLRQVRSAWSDEWATAEAPEPLDMPYQDILIGDLLGQVERHNVEPLMHTPAGQGVAYFDRQRSVREVMEDIVGEAADVIAGLPKRSRLAGY